MKAPGSVRHSVLIVGYDLFGSDRIFEPLARRMGENSELTTRIVVNIHPRPGESPDPIIRSDARNFLKSSWPFHLRPSMNDLPDSREAQGEPKGQRARQADRGGRIDEKHRSGDSPRKPITMLPID